ncbi:multifunctional CCA addition/repair protein [Alcanivorax sp.]|jgi:tRNA nucleotidyltransferase (CCA-adding enzyme)|uniref:multifunctional CCA addition/repair protein n=1 Tax=Alcanivorax sp. TaxID=1872427 RepID=UPI0032D94BE0
MKVYLVGGAVRDSLLGLPVMEKDWVVVGATPEEMEADGFRPVGKDFPVFLHPNTQEEYALARTERKSGHGYGGFTFHAASDVSLEEDLIRRDLTINAMAKAKGGKVIDPFSGRIDLKARLLRHVSPAFAEDPLRVLRVARFASRYHWLGFRVAEDTLTLMKQLTDSGELGYLVPERVWKETSRALMERDPQVFFQVLHRCGALHALFPEVAALDGVPQPEQHHPEIDTLVHQYLCLEQAAKLGLSLHARYALLCHDLGKGKTPKEEWPRHIAHEIRSARMSSKVSKRLKVPREAATLAALVAEFHTHCHRALELKPATVWKLFKALDILRRPERLTDFLGACEADARGRTGFEDREYPQANYLRGAADAARQVDVQALRTQGHEGPALGEAIESARIDAITTFKQQEQPL